MNYLQAPDNLPEPINDGAANHLTGLPLPSMALQSNAYKEWHPAFRSLGVHVFGMSTQTTAYQQELAERLQLPFAILSDHQYAFQHALKLPTFVSEGNLLLKRLTLIVKDGVIKTVHYPVFPSDADASWAMAYLKSQLQQI
jgi:peroxiredoxin